MEVQTQDTQERIELSDRTFGCAFNEALVHQAVTTYLAGARAGTKAHKNRAAARGGGAKPWRQKGTGRARVGTLRSPLWRGGGKAFAAAPRDFAKKLNKKMYRAAMRSIFSELARQERLVIVGNFAVDSPKTKELVSRLNDLLLDHALIVTTEVDRNLQLAARNLPRVDVTEVAQLNPVSLIRYEKVLITAPALDRVEKWLS